MIVDGITSLQALGGAGTGLEPLPGPPGSFAARLWSACAMPGPAWRVAGPGAQVLPGAGWHEIFVCGKSGRSPYAALRDISSPGDTLPGPVACLTLGGGGLQGQHGRVWCAEPGNLHLSVAMPCDLDAATCGPPLPMLAAVAVCEAVESLVGAGTARGAGLSIKWVNDVVLSGGKLGGVLTAMRTRGPRVSEYFAGIALNLARAPQLDPDPFALPAAALAAVAAEMPTLAAATDAVLARLLHRLAVLAAQGPDDLVEAYRTRSLVLGREVAVWDVATRQQAMAAGPADGLPPPGRRGVVTAIGRDLALELDGQPEPVRDGCLRLVGP